MTQETSVSSFIDKIRERLENTKVEEWSGTVSDYIELVI